MLLLDAWSVIAMDHIQPHEDDKIRNNKNSNDKCAEYNKDVRINIVFLSLAPITKPNLLGTLRTCKWTNFAGTFSHSVMWIFFKTSRTWRFSSRYTFLSNSPTFPSFEFKSESVGNMGRILDEVFFWRSSVDRWALLSWEINPSTQRFLQITIPFWRFPFVNHFWEKILNLHRDCTARSTLNHGCWVTIIRQWNTQVFLTDYTTLTGISFHQKRSYPHTFGVIVADPDCPSSKSAKTRYQKLNANAPTYAEG